MASQPVSSSTICNYNFDSYIRGYHAYKDRWNQLWIGEVLLLERDPTNHLEPPPPKITRYQDAIASLEAVQTFLDSKGHSEEATRVAPTMD